MTSPATGIPIEALRLSTRLVTCFIEADMAAYAVVLREIPNLDLLDMLLGLTWIGAAALRRLAETDNLQVEDLLATLLDTIALEEGRSS